MPCSAVALCTNHPSHLSSLIHEHVHCVRNLLLFLSLFLSLFFFNDTATTEIYTLSLHDALPICRWINSCSRAVASWKGIYEILLWSDLPGIGIRRGIRRRQTSIVLLNAGLSIDRKSTRLNSSHKPISYAVFCLKKKSTRLNSSHTPISSATPIVGIN